MPRPATICPADGRLPAEVVFDDCEARARAETGGDPARFDGCYARWVEFALAALLSEGRYLTRDHREVRLA